MVAPIEIVLPETPTAVERTAAAELGEGILKMTGERVPVVMEKSAAAGMRFYVGATRMAAASSGTQGPWKPDEIAVRSVPSGVVLAGDATRGSIYAVDTYLEEFCGVRWWAADAAHYPKRTTLPVTDIALRYAPPFRYRETYYHGALDPLFKVRLKGNFTSRTKYQLTQPKRIPAAWGGDSTLYYFEKRASSYHSVMQILPPDRYFAAHPDWYALEKTGRAPHQLCLTNPEMRQAFIAELDTLLTAHPETDFIQVSQEDRPICCLCAACQAVAAEEGAVSGLYLRFVNAVAAALEAKHPRVTFDTFAYRFTRKPPRVTRPRHNVTVRLCDIECAFNAPLETFPGNRAFLSDLEGWSRLAAGRLYIWDYATNFKACLLPHPNLETYAPNIRLFAKSGAIGVFEQGDSVCRAGSLAPFRAWYLAHLLWNPQADEKKLRAEFLAGYYGPHAAPHMAAYLAQYDKAGRASAAKGVAVFCYHANVTDFWTKEDALQACAELDAAREAARGDGDEFVRRIDQERLSTTLMRSLNWQAWNLGSEEERQTLAKSWHSDCRAFGVTAYREAWGAADFEACADAVERGLVPDASKGTVPKSKARFRTFCNPMSIPDMPIGHECWKHFDGEAVTTNTWPKWAYNCWHDDANGEKKVHQFRELADPEMYAEGGMWYLYPSCGAMWTSADSGGSWQHVKLEEHSEYAPAFAKFRGKYYLVYSYGPLMVSDSPAGPFRQLGRFVSKTFVGDEQPASYGDPALFADGDHLYLYWGCVSPTKSLWGCELDPDNPLRAKTPARRMVTLDAKLRPWMRGPLEGAFVFKRGDTYYFTHAGGSPDGYSFFVWKGKHPLGPFVPQNTPQPVYATNPRKGLVCGTGHGSIWQTEDGDWWIAYTVWPHGQKFHSFERFIGFDRISFDAEGNLMAGSGTSEPQWLPLSGKRGATGWKRIKLATSFPKAADDELRTYAIFPKGTNTMEFVLEKPACLQAFRVIWCDLGLDIKRGIVPGPYQYRLEYRNEGPWMVWHDAAKNTVDLTCEYREMPPVTARAVRLVLLGAPAGITPAVTEFSVFGASDGTHTY